MSLGFRGPVKYPAPGYNGGFKELGHGCSYPKSPGPTLSRARPVSSLGGAPSHLFSFLTRPGSAPPERFAPVNKEEEERLARVEFAAQEICKTETATSGRASSPSRMFASGAVHGSRRFKSPESKRGLSLVNEAEKIANSVLHPGDRSKARLVEEGEGKAAYWEYCGDYKDGVPVQIARFFPTSIRDVSSASRGRASAAYKSVVSRQTTRTNPTPPSDAAMDLDKLSLGFGSLGIASGGGRSASALPPRKLFADSGDEKPSGRVIDLPDDEFYLEPVDHGWGRAALTPPAGYPQRPDRMSED